jgi:hypothetical protein
MMAEAKPKSNAGRKALDPKFRLAGRIQVICTLDEQEQFTAVANSEGLTPSQWMRNLAVKALKKK